MRAFACGRCGRLVFFENTACLHCGSSLAFSWEDRELLAFPDAEPVRCANAELAGCNWLAREPGALCPSCERTTTRPHDTDESGLGGFRVAEAAKRRLLFQLGELGLPIEGLRFDLLSSAGGPVTTGHADGLITLDLAESDDARRERLRHELGEPYRTVLGTLRHESGHALWPLLTEDDAALARARAVFGDDTADYQAALERHYAEGPPDDWAERHVSAYATMHPMEDWAETFAHYLHISDAVQTAAAHGVGVAGPPVVDLRRRAEDLSAVPTPEPRGIDGLIGDWLPLSYALNAINRSMGKDDLYPFVLPEPAIEKLGVVHDLIAAHAAARAAPAGGSPA